VHIYLHLDDIIIPWEHTKRGDFLAQNFIGLYAVIQVFGGFDGLSGISHSKIAAKNAY